MTDDRLSDIFFALSAPTRRGALARLALSDATVKELAQPYRIGLAAVSKHLKALEKAGHISRTKDAQYRPCHLNAAPLQAAADRLQPKVTPGTAASIALAITCARSSQLRMTAPHSSRVQAILQL